MPGRSAESGEGYRYGYQGQYAEEDGQAGWLSFELRNYDPRIARWTSIDPYEQYWSPYISMGNDPVNTVDPDGGKNVYYDSEGNHLRTTKDHWFHNTFVGTNRFWNGNKVSEPQFWDLSGMTADCLCPVSSSQWQGRLTEHKPNFWARLNEGSFLGSMAYSTLDNLLVNVQRMTPFGGDTHLDGSYSRTPADFQNAYFGTVTDFVPVGKTIGVVKASFLLPFIKGAKSSSIKAGKKYVFSDPTKVKSIYRSARESGFNILDKSSKDVRKLQHPSTSETLIFRKSKSGSYKGFDTVTSPLGGGKNIDVFFKPIQP